jgi:hypothetical protein
MSKSYYIPRAEADFNTWVNILIAYLIANAVKFNFPPDVLAELQALQAVWNKKYAIATTPETRTKATIQEKGQAHKAFESFVRKTVKEYLTNNHLVTDADRDNMGLPIYKTTRTHIQAATDFPYHWEDTSIIRRLAIYFHDKNSKTNGKAPGMHGVEARWAILDTPPATIEELLHSGFDTRTPFVLNFEENQRGKTVYFCLCWENNTGEKGPWSEIVKAIIP